MQHTSMYELNNHHNNNDDDDDDYDDDNININNNNNNNSLRGDLDQHAHASCTGCPIISTTCGSNIHTQTNELSAAWSECYLFK